MTIYKIINSYTYLYLNILETRLFLKIPLMCKHKLIKLFGIDFSVRFLLTKIYK